MSSIQGIAGAVSAAQTKPVAPKAPAANAVQPETPAQEAIESAAQTRAEASKGDQQAQRKLAQADAAAYLAKPKVNLLA